MREIEESQFRNKVTVLSFCTVLLVISAHTYNVGSYGLREYDDLLSSIVVWLEDWIRRFEGDFCIGFMFAVSGYLFYFSFTWEKLLQKYKSRFWSVGIPYLFWCSFYYFYYCIITRMPLIAAMVNDGVPVEFSILNWFRWLTIEKYYVLWYLQDLIFMIACAPIIYILLKNHFRKPTGLIVLIFFFLIELGVIKIPYAFFNVHYLVGAYLGINYKRIPHMESKGICYIARILLLLLLLWELICIKLGIDYNQIMPVLLYSSVWFSLGGKLFTQKVKWWYKLSFFLYCIHDFYLEAFEKLFYLILGNSSLWALTAYICMPFAVVAVGILTAAILKKLFPQLWIIIAGGRG